MKDFARSLVVHFLNIWGDVSMVTPAGFATGLRIVGKIPERASPLQIEAWVGQFGNVRVGVAHEDVAGFGYSHGDTFVIETGRGRSPEERSITIPHEFGERLQIAIDLELMSRGLAPSTWSERFWDAMGVELASPLAEFRAAAQATGFDLVDIAKPLSYEAAVYRLGEAFERDHPLFAVYCKNDTHWTREKGYAGDTWSVKASRWTKRWMNFAYKDQHELLQLPRRGSPIREGSFAWQVRDRGRPLLVHTEDHIDGVTLTADIIMRGRFYGRDPGWVIAVGVPSGYSRLLEKQVQLADPIERRGSFRQLF